VAQGVVTQFTFTNRTTGDMVNMTATQPTDAKGNAVGHLSMDRRIIEALMKAYIVFSGGFFAGYIAWHAAAYVVGVWIAAFGVVVVTAIVVAITVAVVLTYYLFFADDPATLFLAVVTESSPPSASRMGR
jgi:hypothetical protein